jgi:hypothetical protein
MPIGEWRGLDGPVLPGRRDRGDQAVGFRFRRAGQAYADAWPAPPVFRRRRPDDGREGAYLYFAFSVLPVLALRQARSRMWIGRRAHAAVITSFSPLTRWSAMFW